MRRRDAFLIIAVVLTTLVSVVIFFFDFYNYHFELKKTESENTYVALKNGRYFEFLCGNDVIDNAVDFTLKPFVDFSVEGSGNMFNQEVLCVENDSVFEKRIVFKRTAKKMSVRQNISANDGNVGENSFYYTHIEYPLVAKIEEDEKFLKLYDLNCNIYIPKKPKYVYSVVENSIRIGVEYAEEMNIIFDMEVECL